MNREEVLDLLAGPERPTRPAQRPAPAEPGLGTRESPRERWDRAQHFSEGAYAQHVEQLPIGSLSQYLDPEVPLEKLHRQESGYLASLRQHVTEHGMRDPIVLGYDPKRRQAMVTDGHHRLAVAAEAGLTHVPVRVQRHSFDQTGGSTVPGHEGEGHPPSEMSPSQIGLRPQ